MLCAYSPGAPAPKAPPQASVERLHKAVADENHAEAKRLADVLLQSPNQADRIAASLVYGRTLLSLGQKDQARQYLAGMKRLNLDPNAAQLVQVYEAWLTFLDGREDEGVKTLEQVLVDKKPLSSTAEAADVLAILYLKRADKAAAKRAVDFGLAFIKYDKSGGGKIPGYVETLLKNRLKTDPGDAFPEAKKLYDQAEKLRQDGKLAEAGKLFMEVSSKYPRSVWSHASGFRIGQCLVGLNRKPEALAHWQALLVGQASSLPGQSSSAPRQVGNLPYVAPLPWRGQATAALIDLLLETTVDVKTARELAHAAGAVLDKGADEEAKPSWDAAAFDIRLRQGVLDLVSKHPDQAAAAFEQAASLLPSPSGRGAGGEGLLLQAKLAYIRSLEDDAAAVWHEETLRELALLIEDLAESQVAAMSRPPAAKPDPKPGPKTPNSPDSRDSRAAPTPDQLRAALQAARAEPLPYWAKLIEQFPQSRHLPQALYHAGVLYSEGPGAKPDPEKSAAHFERLVKEFPTSPWTGDAHVRLIDVCLEQRFDLPAAEKHAQAALKWMAETEQRDARSVPDALRPTSYFPLPAGQAPAASPYSIYLRAGLVAYLSGKKDQAVAMFREAKKLDDSVRKESGAETAMDRMIAVVQGSQTPLTPPELVASLKDDKQKTGIMLADLALLSFDPERAGRLYERLLAGNRPFPAPTAGVEAYLLLRLGQALEFQRRHDEAMACLKRLYDPKYAKYPWTADGIFRVGTWTHNATQDPAAGMAHWEHIFTKYPKHPEAERSLFYYGLSAMRAKDYQKAAVAFEEYLRRYPDSRWTKRVETELLPEAKTHSKERRK